MNRPASPHLITTYNEREQVTPRELSIRVPAILHSKDEDGVKGCRVAGAINNYTSQLLTYGSSSQSPSCKSSRQYNLTEALLFLSHFIGDIHKVVLPPNPQVPDFCKCFCCGLQLKPMLLVYVATKICTSPCKASSDLRLNPSLCSMISRKHMSIMLKLFTLALLCLMWLCQTKLICLCCAYF
ncbi:unnamed protein product [Triticum turgidum subsp. durum]|uniref:Aspergillus nuclease S1 n=1 Tax=Triticum turgidum subsp. durum TaxID=4567 RepID=A0A9R0WVY2_TRITD|nr:unnamed protein product [Triticum turgidum subsp. durum]